MMGILRKKKPKPPVEPKIMSEEERLNALCDSYAGIFRTSEREEEILGEIGMDKKMVIADIIDYTRRGSILPGDIPFVGLILPSFFLKGMLFSVSGKDLEEKTNPDRFDIKWNSHWLYGVRIEDAGERSFKKIRTLGEKRGLLTTIEIVNLYLLCPWLLKQDEVLKVLCKSPSNPGRFRIMIIQNNGKRLVFGCSVADYGDPQKNIEIGTKLASCFGRMPVSFLDD